MIPVIPGDVLIRAIATAIVLALLHLDVRLIREERARP